MSQHTPVCLLLHQLVLGVLQKIMPWQLLLHHDLAEVREPLGFFPVWNDMRETNHRMKKRSFESNVFIKIQINF